MVPILFAGETLMPLPEHALWWPARATLIVADLHLEKASHYARRGQMLPPYDSEETLARLAGLAEALGAAEILCLGDSFHDSDGPERLAPAARSALDGLAARVRLVWVRGNHDRGAAIGEGCEEAVVGPIVFRHEAEPGDAAPEVSGHFHPKLSVAARGRAVSRRCFVHGPCKLVLPAFGALTGGLDARHPALKAAVGRPAIAMVARRGALHRFPLGA